MVTAADDPPGLGEQARAQLLHRRVRPEVANDLSAYTGAASGADRPELLEEYLRWRASVDERRGLGRDPLVAELAAFDAVLEECGAPTRRRGGACSRK